MLIAGWLLKVTCGGALPAGTDCGAAFIISPLSYERVCNCWWSICCQWPGGRWCAPRRTTAAEEDGNREALLDSTREGVFNHFILEPVGTHVDSCPLCPLR
jgi:hypothetical protein